MLAYNNMMVHDRNPSEELKKYTVLNPLKVFTASIQDPLQMFVKSAPPLPPLSEINPVLPQIYSIFGVGLMSMLERKGRGGGGGGGHRPHKPPVYQ